MNTNQRIPQHKQVLGFLRLHGSITPLQAIRLLKCYRLGARIHELRRDGKHITSELVKSSNNRHFSKYTLING